MSRFAEHADDPLLHTFLQLCAIPSPARHEQEVAAWVRGYLGGLGVDVREDDVAERIGAGCGNLHVRLPATAPGTPIFLCAHVDTVPLEDELEPVVEDRDGVAVVTNARPAILGGDNKGAVAVMLELVRELVEQEVPHAGVELVLTPCEEVGLKGAHALDASVLDARLGYVFDHAGDIGKIVGEAPTQLSMRVTFVGQASHSGIAPEEGRSAIRAAADAICSLPHGRIDERTTTNVGVIRGGSAGNVVPERCSFKAEVRSLDHARCGEVAAEMLAACTDAATRHGCDLEFDQSQTYRGYGFARTAPVIDLAARALEAAGHEPELIPCGGGSDANAFNLAGVPCANLCNGMRMIHTPNEYLEVRDLHAMLDVARQLVRLARDDG